MRIYKLARRLGNGRLVSLHANHQWEVEYTEDREITGHLGTPLFVFDSAQRALSYSTQFLPAAEGSVLEFGTYELWVCEAENARFIEIVPAFDYSYEKFWRTRREQGPQSAIDGIPNGGWIGSERMHLGPGTVIADKLMLVRQIPLTVKGVQEYEQEQS